MQRSRIAQTCQFSLLDHRLRFRAAPRPKWKVSSIDHPFHVPTSSRVRRFAPTIAIDTSGQLFQGWGGGILGNVSGTATDARPPGTGIDALPGFPSLSTMIC